MPYVNEYEYEFCYGCHHYLLFGEAPDDGSAGGQIDIEDSDKLQLKYDENAANGAMGFSWSPCEGCGCSLGGDRWLYVVEAPEAPDVDDVVSGYLMALLFTLLPGDLLPKGDCEDYLRDCAAAVSTADQARAAEHVSVWLDSLRDSLGDSLGEIRMDSEQIGKAFWYHRQGYGVSPFDDHGPVPAAYAAAAARMGEIHAHAEIDEATDDVVICW